MMLLGSLKIDTSQKASFLRPSKRVGKQMPKKNQIIEIPKKHFLHY